MEQLLGAQLTALALDGGEEPGHRRGIQVVTVFDCGDAHFRLDVRRADAGAPARNAKLGMLAAVLVLGAAVDEPVTWEDARSWRHSFTRPSWCGVGMSGIG